MNEKILIIDDEKDVCEVVKDILDYEGFDVKIANTGDQAMEHLKKGIYQLLLVDVRLEGSMNGIDVIKACRALPGKPKIAVISATTASELEPIFRNEGISSIISRILEKPRDLEPSKFTKIIKELIETK